MNNFIKFIENFSLSEVLFVLCAIAGLVLSVEKLLKWILNKFNWYHKKKSQEEDLHEILKVYAEQNLQQSTQIKEISMKLDMLTNATRQNMKHTITKACEDYLARNYITSYELQSLEDLYKVYEEIKGNSFVHTLIYKIRKLKVINNNYE